MTKVRCEYTELVELHKLQPNPKNANKHPEKQIERLAQIIDYQGMRSPIVVSKRSGFITKGHGRLEALKLLEWKTAPVDFQDYENDAQEYADIVSDNAISEWSTLDFSQINIEIGDLGPDFDVDNLGFTNFTIDPWESDIEAVEKTESNLDGIDGKIKITCPQDIKDEVLIYIKDKLLETSFEGIHVE